MNELSKEKKAEQALCFMRMSLEAFGVVALIRQHAAELVPTEYGRMMASMYREFRIKNKFWEVV